jgi:hypothetical protein
MGTTTRHRKIECKIWSDKKFLSLSDDGQIVFFQLLTTQLSTPFGLFRAGVAALAEEKGWPVNRYWNGLRDCSRKGLVKVDESARVILLPRFLKYNPPANPNIVRNWSTWLEEIPDSPLKSEWSQILKRLCERLAKGFPRAYRETIAETVSLQEQEQEQEQDLFTDSPKGESVSPAEADDPSPGWEQEQKRKAAQEAVPVQKVVDLYHKHMPTNPRVVNLRDRLRAQIKARWKETYTDADGNTRRLNSLPDWERLFRWISNECPFLVGREHDPGKGPFTPGLDWLTRAQFFDKIIAGGYLSRQRDTA